jgi:hypothetical protein
MSAKPYRVENLKPEDPKTQTYKVYFWGGIDPNRIKLPVDRDIVLNPPQSGESFNTFGYPFVQVGARTIDWLDSSTFKYRFTFKKN